jgi:hypothetical protein
MSLSGRSAPSLATDVLISANLPAAFGFFLLGAAGIAGMLALFVSRRSWSQRLQDFYLRNGSDATGLSREVYFNWRGSKWDDERYPRRKLVGRWVPPVVACLVVAVAGFGRSRHHYRRLTRTP